MSLVTSQTLPVFLFFSAFTFLLQKTGEPPQSGIPQPADAKEAEREIMEEEADVKFAAAEDGLQRPLNGARPALIIVMGPASCGKSTIGMSLAQSLSLPFIDGDTLHPKTNVEKMTAGTPLTDTDRLPWLALIRSTAERICREEWINQKRSLFGVLGSGEEGSLSRETEDIAGMAEWEFGEGWKWRHAVEEEGSSRQRSLGRPAVVMACSALKKSYREILRGSVEVDLPVEENDGNGTTKVHYNPDPSRLDTFFVYCNGSRELLQDRISKRKNHFMGAKMLDSQLATLEDPTGEEGVVDVDISKTPEEITKSAVKKIIEIVAR